MSQTVMHLKYDINYEYPIILILDPHINKNVWNKIYKVAEGIIRSFPGKVTEAFFLGSRESYKILDPKSFQQHCASWKGKNEGRVALLNPIIEKLQVENFNGLMVVITARTPVDLDDWVEDEFIEQSVFVTVDFELSDDYEDIVQLNADRGITFITDALKNPVKEVWIEGDGFAPLAYDIRQGGTLRVDFKNGNFYLHIQPQSTDTHLELHLKALSNTIPVLHLKREKGGKTLYEPEIERQWVEEPRWQNFDMLDNDVRKIVLAGIEKRDYVCPQCGNTHRFDILICPEGGPVLKGIPHNVCVLFKKDKYMGFSPNMFAFPLSKNRIITNTGKLYQWRVNRWHDLGEIKPYEEVDDGMWALLHRI